MEFLSAAFSKVKNEMSSLERCSLESDWFGLHQQNLHPGKMIGYQHCHFLLFFLTPSVLAFFVLTEPTLPSHLLSSLGNSTLVCRTLVSKNESIWHIIFTCNEPECRHAQKPNYECLVLWQPNKYFTL